MKDPNCCRFKVLYQPCLLLAQFRLFSIVGFSTLYFLRKICMWVFTSYYSISLIYTDLVDEKASQLMYVIGPLCSWHIHLYQIRYFDTVSDVYLRIGSRPWIYRGISMFVKQSNRCGPPLIEWYACKDIHSIAYASLTKTQSIISRFHDNNMRRLDMPRLAFEVD